MLKAQRDVEEREAMGEICRAVEWVNIPAVRALKPGASSLFAIDAMIGESLVQPAYDEFFRCAIGFGHQVHIAFVFRDDAALEVTTQEFAGLRSNIRCASGKTKVKLRGEILQGTLLSTPLGRRLRSLMVRIWCL